MRWSLNVLVVAISLSRPQPKSVPNESPISRTLQCPIARVATVRLGSDVASPQPRARWFRAADGEVNAGFVVTVVVGWRNLIEVVTDADEVVVDGIDAPGCVDSTSIPTSTSVPSTPSNFARRVQ
ncbi:MAG: hypothetical protein ACYDEH_08320 [Acidimicrobiales bacterium]